MALFPTYSQTLQPESTTWIYDGFPAPLKNQCVHIWTEFLSQEGIPSALRQNTIQEIVRTIAKEHGLLNLPSSGWKDTAYSRLRFYFLTLGDHSLALDVIQIVCAYMEAIGPAMAREGIYFGLPLSAERAVAEINARFRQHHIGYQYKQQRIIRLDNELLHAETVDRTFSLLSDLVYRNVNHEYLTAHEHFRHGRNADCLTWSLKAFESVIKVVADQNEWVYSPKATASALVDLLFDNSFFPPYLSTAMANLRSLLQSTLPTIRNKQGGHGSGSQLNIVPESLARFMLYNTGTVISLIVDLQRERTRSLA